MEMKTVQQSFKAKMRMSLPSKENKFSLFNNVLSYHSFYVAPTLGMELKI